MEIYHQVNVCKIQRRSKSNLRRTGDVEGSRTGSFCAELKDLCSRGRLGFRRCIANVDDGSPPLMGDFGGVDENSRNSLV